MAEYDRFRGPRRIKPGAEARGRRLRGAPTFAEAKLWERLRLLNIRIRRQPPIGGYVVDFACLRARLVIEVDGGVHDRTDIALRDLERDAWLRSEGFRVLRIPNARIEQDIEAVVDEIQAAIRASLPNLKQRATTPSQPFPLEGKGFSDI